MARCIVVVAAWTAGALLLLPSPMLAQTGRSPASLARIRAALAEPPPIFQTPAPSGDVLPTFRVEVHQPYFDLEPSDEETFDLTYGLPSVGELLMGGVGKIRSAAVGYKHRRAQRRARQEVTDALAAFCAVHDCPATDSGR
jgi:hypothetical protein